MKVHKNDIEQIKRYCEEKGIKYEYYISGLRIIFGDSLNININDLCFETQKKMDILEKVFLENVRQDCIRRNRELDRIIKGER